MQDGFYSHTDSDESSTPSLSGHTSTTAVSEAGPSTPTESVKRITEAPLSEPPSQMVSPSPSPCDGKCKRFCSRCPIARRRHSSYHAKGHQRSMSASSDKHESGRTSDFAIPESPDSSHTPESAAPIFDEVPALKTRRSMHIPLFRRSRSKALATAPSFDHSLLSSPLSSPPLHSNLSSAPAEHVTFAPTSLHVHTAADRDSQVSADAVPHDVTAPIQRSATVAVASGKLFLSANLVV